VASVVFTVGHSTHSLEAFLGLLARHGVQTVADVRRFPRSRRNPQFDSGSLARGLRARGLRYEHVESLGGRREPRPGSVNAGWEHPAFRGYADHMAGTEFAAGIEQLEELARGGPTAVMCAESLWWRCHRRLVADALLLRGWTVRHIGPDGRAELHELTPFAVGDAATLTYPAAQLRLG
jgi:uncharacterized protein (DUF488 family)